MLTQPIPSTAATGAITGVDPQRVEGGLRRLAPKWTTGFVHTIAKYAPRSRCDPRSPRKATATPGRPVGRRAEELVAILGRPRGQPPWCRSGPARS